MSPYTFRRLDPNEDAPLFEQAYQWIEESPSWRKETEAVFGTLDHEEFMAAPHWDHRVDIGVFAPEFTALVSLTLRAKGVYEISFGAKSGTDPKVIIAAGIEIRDQMWAQGMELAVTWTPRWNRTVLAIDKAIGFVSTNVTMLHGVCRGRLIEWVQLILSRSAYE